MLPSLRITSGIVKNKKLTAPKIEGYRAVQDKAKLAVFSILEDTILDAKCLDLYAGSGSMGLEALSRGAAWCDFVDQSYEAIGAIRQNIADCKFENKSLTHHTDAVKYAANTSEKYDVIFCDPFYKDTAHIFLLKNISEILTENGVLIFFHGGLDFTKLLKDNSLKVVDDRRFGKSFVTFLKCN